MQTYFLAGTALKDMKRCMIITKHRGVTLIELLIVVTVMSILLALAVPGYSNYVLRVNRTEAIRLLLQAAMCQERVNASRGSYDTSLCLPTSSQQRYRISYQSPDTKGSTYAVKATPTGAQLAERCGSLFLEQDGTRGVSSKAISVTKCWNGR
jgi:type IV pilus assembly protein PilE